MGPSCPPPQATLTPRWCPLGLAVTAQHLPEHKPRGLARLALRRPLDGDQEFPLGILTIPVVGAGLEEPHHPPGAAPAGFLQELGAPAESGGVATAAQESRHGAGGDVGGHVVAQLKRVLQGQGARAETPEGLGWGARQSSALQRGEEEPAQIQGGEIGEEFGQEGGWGKKRGWLERGGESAENIQNSPKNQLGIAKKI